MLLQFEDVLYVAAMIPDYIELGGGAKWIGWAGTGKGSLKLYRSPVL